MVFDRSLPTGRLRSFAFSLTLSCFVSGCGTAQTTPPPTPMVTGGDDAIAASSSAFDCEWKAADHYDDGRYTVSELAQRIMGICAAELTNARLALHLSLTDPAIQLDEFKQAAGIVDDVRKRKYGGKWRSILKGLSG